MAQLILILLVVLAILMPSKTKEVLVEIIDEIQVVYVKAVKIMNAIEKE